MIELLLLRTGSVELPRAKFTPWADAPDERVLQPVWSAVVRTPEATILFDTGLHPVHASHADATFGPLPDLRVVMAHEDALLRRLHGIGLAARDVDVVVNSHLHFDHAGNNRAFPDATFLVQAEHLVHARATPQAFPPIYWDDPSLRIVPVSGEARVAPGVRVVPTPGHAPGHQSLVVDLAGTGRVVLCGDAAFTRENLERGEEPARDADAARASLALIRSLVDGDLDRAFVSHDATQWERWRTAPDAYR